MVKPTKVANSIRSLRFAQGEMTQAQLAATIGVARQTVIAIEKGGYSPSLEMAFRIAQALNVPLDDVFQYPVPSTNQGTKHMESAKQKDRSVRTRRDGSSMRFANSEVVRIPSDWSMNSTNSTISDE
jgi:putative transcriptional regulator